MHFPLGWGAVCVCKGRTLPNIPYTSGFRGCTIRLYRREQDAASDFRKKFTVVVRFDLVPGVARVVMLGLDVG